MNNPRLSMKRCMYLYKGCFGKYGPVKILESCKLGFYSMYCCSSDRLAKKQATLLRSSNFQQAMKSIIFLSLE